MAKVTAVGIKKLYYGDPAKIMADVTLASLKTLLRDESTKQVENIHQDTWSIEEEEPSTTEYRNQLTNGVYRQSTEMGNIQMSFTIGQYDYSTKADLMGGTATATSWKRNRGVVIIERFMVALTEDNQYCVFPKASVIARDAQTDGASAIGVVATALEPDNAAVSSEYWFDASEEESV